MRESVTSDGRRSAQIQCAKTLPEGVPLTWREEFLNPHSPDNAADAAFAMPEVYEFLEAEQTKYAIPATGRPGSAELLTRPVGRPPPHVRRFHANFS